jgi:3'-5' exoribonuclease-like protein
MKEIYWSVDVETDGPAPGPHSMLSLGAVAFNDQGDEVASYSVNLETLPGAQPHPQTAAWWAKNKEAYEVTRQNCVSPTEAMATFGSRISAIEGRPVFVAYPAGFDFTFVYWYFHKFTGASPFGFQALDIKSYAMAMLRTAYRDTVKKRMPRAWFPPVRHSHVALEDAREQGLLFINMMKANHHRSRERQQQSE